MVRCYVSIPAGFSDALRLTEVEDQMSNVTEFQFLLGFLMRCDSPLILCRVLLYPSFNPCWVF